MTQHGGETKTARHDGVRRRSPFWLRCLVSKHVARPTESSVRAVYLPGMSDFLRENLTFAVTANRRTAWVRYAEKGLGRPARYHGARPQSLPASQGHNCLYCPLPHQICRNIFRHLPVTALAYGCNSVDSEGHKGYWVHKQPGGTALAIVLYNRPTPDAMHSLSCQSRPHEVHYSCNVKQLGKLACLVCWT